jgi:hypothetical protein
MTKPHAGHDRFFGGSLGRNGLDQDTGSPIEVRAETDVRSVAKKIVAYFIVAMSEAISIYDFRKRAAIFVAQLAISS